MSTEGPFGKARLVVSGPGITVPFIALSPEILIHPVTNVPSFPLFDRICSTFLEATEWARELRIQGS